jgi:hypothetical protein
VRPPDLQGQAGRAWRLEFAPINVDTTASLARWLVNVPGAHPFWEWWQIHLIHLKDIPGQTKPATKTYPEAEYEFGILAINPESCPHPDPEKHKDGYPYLTPPDVVEQFDVKGSDRDAVRITDACVRGIVNGFITPDQDGRAMWKKLIKNTADHFKSGAHPEH